MGRDTGDGLCRTTSVGREESRVALGWGRFGEEREDALRRVEAEGQG